MKKLIAIAIVFALAAGAAFADTAIGAGLDVRVKLVDHTLGPDGAQPKTNGFFAEGNVSFTATNDDGDFGGKLRLKPLKVGNHTHKIDSTATPDSDGFVTSEGGGAFELPDQVWAWWKPFDSLEIFIGKDADGKFNFYNAWSHFQGAEGYMHIHDWGKWRSAMTFNNFDTFGIALTLKPIDGLAVNLVIPTDGEKELRNVYGGGLVLTGTYDIDSIGQVWLGYKGPGSNMFAKKYTGYSYGQFGFGFQLDGGIVDGLDLQAGFSTYLNNSDAAVDKAPLFFMLKANYAAGDFGVKTRWRFTIDGNGDHAQGQDYVYVKDLTEFAFDIMPYYDLGFLTAYLNIGVKVLSSKNVFVTVRDKNGITTGTEKSLTVFSINPYIRKSLGAGSIRAGVLVEINPMDRGSHTGWAYMQDKVAKLSIPVSFVMNF